MAGFVCHALCRHQYTTDHRGNQFLASDVARGTRHDGVPIPKHSDAISEREYFRHSVSDVHDGHSLTPQLADQPENELFLLASKGRRGFVEEQNGRILRDCARDFENLLHAH